jgi:uncharacterized protein (UPF0332 family)
MKKVLEKIYKQGLIREEKIGFDQIRKRLNRADKDLQSAKILLNSDNVSAYKMAYDSMLQAGISLILAYSYRPQVKNFHKTIVLCTKQVLGREFGVLVKKFDQIRRNRHDAIYDEMIISEVEAKNSIVSAEEFMRIIEEHIKNLNPQKELF